MLIIAIPSLEQNHKNEIVVVFGYFLKLVHPMSEQGVPGILFFSCLVAIWDGISVLPVRYVEFLTALCYSNVSEYLVVMLLGKTIGGYLTFKACNRLIKNKKLEEIILNNGFSLYVSSVSDLVRERPLFFGLLFRMYFPSILSCMALALLPLNQTQFVFIQFLQALLLSCFQASFDYFPYIEKKLRNARGQIYQDGTGEHADIIKRGIDNSRLAPDLFKSWFVLTQIFVLIYLTISVIRRNRKLQLRF